MSGLAIGCVLSGVNAPSLITPGASISCTLTPLVQPLFEGQSLSDLPDYAAMVSPGNFASSQGGIATVEVSFSGDAADASTVLAEGETAGFSVTVTDSADNTGVFVADPVTVAYKLRIEATAGGDVDIDINPMVPDGESLGDIVIDVGSVYDATYTGITAGDIRGGPYNFGAAGAAGLPMISGTTGPGDTLTVDEGLWHTPTGTALSFSYQWRSDGTDIDGATGSSFEIAASEQGSDVTCAVTGNDGSSTTTAETPAIAIPGAAPAITLTQINYVNNTYIGAGHNTFDIDLDVAGANAGDSLLILYAYSARFYDESLEHPLDLKINSVTQPAFFYRSDGTAQSRSKSLYGVVYDASAGGTISLDVVPTENEWAGFTRWVFLVSGHSSISAMASGATNKATGALDLSADSTPGSIILGIMRNLQNPAGGAGASLTGLAVENGPLATSADGTQLSTLIKAEPLIGETPRTMSLDNIDAANTWSAVVQLLEIA
ncbi:hypothetical protein GI582_22900 [Sulfitobacter sp. BDSS02]|nr:hypothetical protein [Sulfitobacter sp. BDSS02]